jgi:alpha-beta hydrolase superfamily lysophospholipase
MGPLITPDGRALHLMQWPASAARRALGTVQIVHGLGEHMGRYAPLAAMLNAAGWHVVGHDHWGHGRSGGARGALSDEACLMSDLAAVRDQTHCNGRVVLLGHSLGGLVAARFVAEDLAATPAPWARGVDGLVLSSPALDIGLGALHRALLALLLPWAPGLPLGNGLKPQWVCSDPAVVQAYLNDPLVHRRITPRMVRFMVDAAELVQSRAPLWRVSTLLQWAGADRCVRPAGSQAFAAAAPGAVLSAQPLAGFAHEIYNEPGREQAFARLRRWLAQFEAQNQAGPTA